MSLSIINTGVNKFDTQLNYAELYNALVDSQYPLSRMETKNASTHMWHCVANPTIGLLARKQTETNNYPKMKKANIEFLRATNEFWSARTIFVDSYNSKYPKTGKARMFLINNSYIVLDKVKKITKDFKRSFFKKFGI